MISLIWAQTNEFVIGDENKLPWSIKKEMDHFRKTTLNGVVLMGSKTFESMNFKPLKNRKNYVLTKDISKFNHLKNENLIFINSIEELSDEYKKNKENNLFIIGGNQIFKLFFPIADILIKTIIYKNYKGNLKIENFDLSNFINYEIIKHDEFEIQYWKLKNN